MLALLIGLIAAASYAMGATIALRVAMPALGAWLDAHQFYLMEGGATAFGLIVGIRIGRRCAAGGTSIGPSVRRYAPDTLRVRWFWVGAASR